MDLFRSPVNESRVVHQSRYAVVEKVTIGKEQRVMVFKRYRHRDRGDLIKHLFRHSRAHRDLVKNQMVEQAGFRSMNSACLLEKRWRGVVLESALLTEWIDDAPTIRKWFTESGIDRTGKRRLIDALALETARFHESGLYHGDMRLTNILCHRADSHIFYWIDNERSRRYRTLPLAQRIRNLMQLNMDRHGLTRTDRMRFWRTYAETAELPASDRKAIARQVIRWTQERWKERGWL